jgi:hypothetical protein
MSFDVSIGEKCPSIGAWMLPAFVPIRLGKFGSNSVNCFDRIGVVNAIVVGCYTYDGAISFMKTYVHMLETSKTDFIEEPKLRVTG